VKTRIWGLIQARMGSSRLPGKVMLPLAGRPLFLHIFDRLNRVDGLEGIVLATTSDPRNDEMVELADQHGLSVVRWPEEDDIVGRLCAACDAIGADALLKINADCPLVDPEIMQKLLNLFLQSADADFASNKIEQTYPLGYSVELITARALAWCNRNLDAAEDRELVIQWIMDHPEQFDAISLTGPENYSEYDLTVDTPEDFAQVSAIFECLYRPGEIFGLNSVIKFMTEKVSPAP